MKIKVIGKITDGTHVVIKHLATISNTLVNSSEFKRIKIKEHTIESYSDHVIYSWYNNYKDSSKSPDWILDSDNALQIIVTHE